MKMNKACSGATTDWSTCMFGALEEDEPEQLVGYQNQKSFSSPFLG